LEKRTGKDGKLSKKWRTAVIGCGERRGGKEFISGQEEC
jgi:hypothetical protein